MFSEYKSKPIVVSAVRFTNQNKDQVFNALTGQYANTLADGKPAIKVTTANGNVALVKLGDWIVKEEENGFYYPVTHEEFTRRYYVQPDLGGK